MYCCDARLRERTRLRCSARAGVLAVTLPSLLQTGRCGASSAVGPYPPPARPIPARLAYDVIGGGGRLTRVLLG